MKVTIPLRCSDFEEDHKAYEIFLKEIQELSNDKKLVSLIDDFSLPSQNERPRLKSIKIEIVEGNHYNDTEPKFAAELHKRHPFFNPEFVEEYLILTLTPLEKGLIGTDHPEWFVNRFLTRLSLLINLSYATTVDFLYGVIYSNQNKYLGKTDIILSTNMYAYEHSRKMNWPVIKNVKLIDTLNWFHKNNIHPDNRSQNNLQRAINAFSHLFGNLKRKHSADLFWIMLGIESLLVEGNQNITSQFRDKSTLILGKPKEYKRKLNKLYEYRSKLIHGNFDIYPKHFSDYEDFEDEYSDYLDFAISILLALIRELIGKQKNKFEFEMKLIE